MTSAATISITLAGTQQVCGPTKDLVLTLTRTLVLGEELVIRDTTAG